MKKFANAAFADVSVIHSNGYRSYIPALEGYTYEHRSYDPASGFLHWLYIVISFNRRDFGGTLVEHLALSVSLSGLVA